MALCFSPVRYTVIVFFFQAEDGIRDPLWSRGLGGVYKGQYVDLIESSVLDVAISPSLITVGSLLTHVRRGDTIAVHSLRRGAAEAIETIAHGDATSSNVVGSRIEELSLPSGTRVGALLRNQEVIIPHHDTIIEAEDHVILLEIDKKHIRDVERLFQVKVTFV